MEASTILTDDGQADKQNCKHTVDTPGSDYQCSTE